MTRIKSVALWPALMIAAMPIPVIGWNTLPSLPAFWARHFRATSGEFFGGTSFPDSRLPLTRLALGGPFVIPPLITHVQITDFDGDGINDVVAGFSQDDEELWGLENLGGGRFAPRLLYRTVNFDLGSAGLVKVDLDRDGDMDLLLPCGDYLEDRHAYPQPYHGCLWFENQGS